MASQVQVGKLTFAPSMFAPGYPGYFAPKNLSPVQVFKAQRVFKSYCNEAGNITREKWKELASVALLCKDYDYMFGDYCWLYRFMSACESDLIDIDWVWNKLGLEPRLIDDIDARMQQVSNAEIESISKLTLEVKLKKETDWALICVLKTRLASLLLGNALNVGAAAPAEQVAQAKLHLSYVLKTNPAHWEAHKWLALALFQQQDMKGALMSARRSLMLNKEQADTWDFAGCVAALMKNAFHASYMLSAACSLGSYWAAIHYGELFAQSSPRTGAAAFKLAVQLADSTAQAEFAREQLCGVVAADASCADVPVMSVSPPIQPELDIGQDNGDQLLF